MTIAHRLSSVSDYDSIVVLENGQVVQHDSSQVVLKTITKQR